MCLIRLRQESNEHQRAMSNDMSYILMVDMLISQDFDFVAD